MNNSCVFYMAFFSYTDTEMIKIFNRFGNKNNISSLQINIVYDWLDLK